MASIAASGSQMPLFLNLVAYLIGPEGWMQIVPLACLKEWPVSLLAACKQYRLDLEQLALNHLQLQCCFHAKQSRQALQHMYTA